MGKTFVRDESPIGGSLIIHSDEHNIELVVSVPSDPVANARVFENIDAMIVAYNTLASMPDPAKGVERLKTIVRRVVQCDKIGVREHYIRSMRRLAEDAQAALRACGEEVEGG